MIKNWIDASQKPPHSTNVLVNTYDGITVAQWVPRHCVEDTGNYDGDTDYDESGDVYYWPEGWYERRIAEDFTGNSYQFIVTQVTHWQALPETPR